MVYNIRFSKEKKKIMRVGKFPNAELAFGSSDDEIEISPAPPPPQSEHPGIKVLREIKSYVVHDKKRKLERASENNSEPEETPQWEALNFSPAQKKSWWNPLTRPTEAPKNKQTNNQPVPVVTDETKNLNNETGFGSGGPNRQGKLNDNKLLREKEMRFNLEIFKMLEKFYTANYQHANIVQMLPKPTVLRLDKETRGLIGTEFLQKVRYAIDPENGGRPDMAEENKEVAVPENKNADVGAPIFSLIYRERRDALRIFSMANKEDAFANNAIKIMQQGYFQRLEYSGASAVLLQFSREARLRILQSGIRDNPFSDALTARGISCASIIERAESFLYERVNKRLQSDDTLWIYKASTNKKKNYGFDKNAPEELKQLAVSGKNEDVMRHIFNKQPNKSKIVEEIFAHSPSPGLCWFHPDGIDNETLAEVLFQRSKNLNNETISYYSNILKTRHELFGPRMSLSYLLKHMTFGNKNFAQHLRYIEEEYPELFRMTIKFDSLVRDVGKENNIVKICLHAPKQGNERSAFLSFFPYAYDAEYSQSEVYHFNIPHTPRYNDDDLNVRLRALVATEMRRIAERAGTRKKQKINDPYARFDENTDPLLYWLYAYVPEDAVFFPGTFSTRACPLFTCNVFFDWNNISDEDGANTELVPILNNFSDTDKTEAKQLLYNQFFSLDFAKKILEFQNNGDADALLRKTNLEDMNTTDEINNELMPWYNSKIELSPEQKEHIFQKVRARAADIGRLALAHSVADIMWSFGQELRALDLGEEERAPGQKERLATDPELSNIFAGLTATIFERDKLRAAVGMSQWDRQNRTREISLRCEEQIAQIQRKLGDTPRFVLPAQYNFL